MTNTTIDKITAESLPKLDSSKVTIKVLQDKNISKHSYLDVLNVIETKSFRVKTNKHGLLFSLIPVMAKYEYSTQDYDQIIPGNFSFEKVVDYIMSRGDFDRDSNNIELKSNIRKHIEFNLEESGIWANRGKLSWHNTPEDFWKTITVYDFTLGNIRSFQSWYVSAISSYNQGEKSHRNKFGWQNQKDVLKSIEKKEIPENINRVRNWNKISFEQFAKFNYLGYTDKVSWPIFSSNIFNYFYESFMTKHNDWLELNIFDESVKYLDKLPKNEKVIECLNALSNSGLSASAIISLDLKSTSDMTKAAQFSKQYESIARKNRKHLNSTYKPPVFELLKDKNGIEIPNQFIWNNNYVWADHLTFSNLSDEYNCCISRFGTYESKMVDGMAHTLYAKSHQQENHMGVVAYISYDAGVRYYNHPNEVPNNGKWYVQEIRAFANQNPHAKHKAYAESVVAALNERLPGKHKPVVQMEKGELLKELSNDPIGRKVAEIWFAEA